ncbi:hypothetical protein ACIBSV_48045 [Embleya sp. NPDC050154]|uniref:hypothetical protein n=1 Tax=unclassified Embleya TaxID=2699296 RepID=UPI0037ACA233
MDRITPYDPAAANSTSGRIPTRTRIRHDAREAIATAYTAATAGFALDAAIHRLAIDNPVANGFHSDDRTADDGLRAELSELVAARGPELLEEHRIGNAFRWHRLAGGAEIRSTGARLTPRARLTVCPDPPTRRSKRAREYV